MPIWAWHGGTAQVNGMLEKHHPCIQKGFFILSLHSCDKYFPILFLSVINRGFRWSKSRRKKTKSERGEISQ